MTKYQSSGATGGHRDDIQGLRAIAVLIVLIFHIWPSVLPGGYVGVDVFFVISGFLITGLLAREAQSTGRVDLLRFYGRRVRRLMPAAAVVVVFSAGAALLIPVVQWPSLAKDLIASTFYVQNWWLIEQSIDYLNHGHAPSLLQHYWSLSVEEQYYLLWPVLLLVGLTLKGSRKSSALLFGPLILVIGLASFAYGMFLIQSQPDVAYFSTFSRIWELALGGLLAIYGSSVKSTRITAPLAAAVGLLAISFSAFFYTEKMAFPGAIALLPTLGALSLLWAGMDRNTGVFYNVLALRPMLFLGGISYSLYLWHWPLILVFKSITNAELNFLSGLAVLVLALVLSYATKIFIEDKFRFSSKLGFAATKVLLACVALAIISSVGLKQLYAAKVAQGISAAQSAEALIQLANQTYNPRLPTIPDGLTARKDNPDLYRRKCHVGNASAEPIACEFGDQNAEKLLMLVGDSHAGQWLPALQALELEANGWRITTHTKSDCPFITGTISNPKKDGNYDSCAAWGVAVSQLILEAKPNLIITSASNQYDFPSVPTDQQKAMFVEAYKKTWQPLLSEGISILVIGDTPRMPKDIPECMTSPFGSTASCSVRRSDIDLDDPISLAASETEGVQLIDFTDDICALDVCSPVKGQLLIWRDSHHLSGTYARYLAPKFLEVAPELSEGR